VVGQGSEFVMKMRVGQKHQVSGFVLVKNLKQTEGSDSITWTNSSTIVSITDSGMVVSSVLVVIV